MATQIYIKPEPLDEDDAVYCRSCFKLMTENVKDPETETLFKWFEEIIQMPIRESKNASIFCFDCSVSIGSFIQFKKLAELKQKKFYEIMDGFSNDFSELFFIKLKADPLTVIIKEESNNMSLMRSEEFDDSSPEPRSSKRSFKKTSVETTGSKQMTCPICTKNVDDVVDHLRMCKGKQCNKCKFKTVDVDEMEQHKRERHGSRKVKKVETAKRVRLEKMRVKDEVSASRLKLTYSCDQCGREFNNKGSIIVHTAKHMKEKPIKCTLCSYSTIFKKYLKNHMKNKHESGAPVREFQFSGRGRCEVCKKDYKSLKAHNERVHGKIKNFQCQDCGKNFYSNYDLVTHVGRVHQNIKNFQCQDCGSWFYSKQDLSSHMHHKHSHRLTELDMAKFICETCGKGFGRKQLYDLHQRTHLTLDFQCHLCDKKFAMKSRVEEHIKRTHLKIMDKECDVCGKRFFNTSKLNVHYNVHAGIKFHCYVEGCSTARSRRDAMVYHMKNDHQLCNSEREKFMEQLNTYCSHLKRR